MKSWNKSPLTPTVTPSTSFLDEDQQQQTCHHLDTRTLSKNLTLTPSSTEDTTNSSIEYDDYDDEEEEIAIVDKPSPPPDVYSPVRKVRSRINANIHAVEVTLDDTEEPVSTDMSSLSPQPKAPATTMAFNLVTPETPVRVRFCGGMPGYFCDTEEDDYLHVSPNRSNFSIQNHFQCFESKVNCSILEADDFQHQVEHKICHSLGDGLCLHPWQESFAPGSTPSPPVIPPSHTSPQKRALQRRAFDTARRQSRLRDLGRDLNPFDSEPPRPLRCTRSFQFERTKPMEPKLTPKPQFASVWECGAITLDCNKPAPNHSPALIRSQWELECQGYDSDPEEWNAPETRPSFSTLPPPQESISTDERVEEFLNERVTFILHEGGKSMAVHVWTERGQRLRDRLILPKLVWKRVENSNDIKVWTCSALNSMELLDIWKILPLAELDRENYPFVIRSRAFFLQTVDGRKIILEARNQETR
jgi:hypothetical protein